MTLVLCDGHVGVISPVVDGQSDTTCLVASTSPEVFVSELDALSHPLYKKMQAFSFGDIVERCKKEHGYSDEDMLLLERELKRYLYLCVASDPSLDMYSRDVDNLWHAFILHTPEYHKFCQEFAGRYIHHIPTRERDIPQSDEQRVAAFKKYRDFIVCYEQAFGGEIDPVWLVDMFPRIS